MLPGKACGMLNTSRLSLLRKYVLARCTFSQRALAALSRRPPDQLVVENEEAAIYPGVGSTLFLSSERMDACLFIPSLRLFLTAGLLSLNSFRNA
jgi:hypothetical protein